jgi:hypothetical protein
MKKRGAPARNTPRKTNTVKTLSNFTPRATAFVESKPLTGLHRRIPLFAGRAAIWLRLGPPEATRLEHEVQLIIREAN